MTPAIRIENLELTLAGKPILGGISFAVEPGEYISVVGPNGAGKTSLIKCLCGLHAACRGTVHLNGQNAAQLSARQRARLLSYVPQAEGQSVPFSVREFVLLGRYPHLSPFTTVTDSDHAAVETALEQTGTAVFKDRKVNTLSGGERQMVFIAAALAQEAEILILDEPAAFLDYRHQAEVFQLLRRINRELGRTILTVSHDINAAARHSTRILAVKGGKTAFYGTPENLMTPEWLGRIFDTRFRFIREPGVALPLAITAHEPSEPSA